MLYYFIFNLIMILKNPSRKKVYFENLFMEINFFLEYYPKYMNSILKLPFHERMLVYLQHSLLYFLFLVLILATYEHYNTFYYSLFDDFVKRDLLICFLLVIIFNILLNSKIPGIFQILVFFYEFIICIATGNFIIFCFFVLSICVGFYIYKYYK